MAASARPPRGPKTTAKPARPPAGSPPGQNSSSGPGEPQQPPEGQSSSFRQAVDRGKGWGSKAAAATAKPTAKATHAVGGLLFGMFAYALLINGIRYGTPGITGWLNAKFFNKPMQGPAVAGGGGASPAPGNKPSESLASGSTSASGSGVTA